MHMQMVEFTAIEVIHDHNLPALMELTQKGFLLPSHCFSRFTPFDVRGHSLLHHIIHERFAEGLHYMLSGQSEGLEPFDVDEAFNYSLSQDWDTAIRQFLEASISGNIFMNPAEIFKYCMHKKMYDLAASLIAIPAVDVNMEINLAQEHPIHYTVLHNQIELTQQLLERGTVVDIVSRKGITPLILACSMALPAMVELLLQHGADPNLRTNREVTPYSSPFVSLFLSSGDSSVTDQILELLLKGGLHLNQEASSLETSFKESEPKYEPLSQFKLMCMQPRSLQLSCFHTIRQKISQSCGGTSISKYLDKLPTAPGLQRYLRMDV